MFLGCGALNMDYLFAADHLVTDGESRCNPVGRQPGGSAANTIYAIAKLGLSCRFAGAVGEDADGIMVLESLAATGVDTKAIVVRGGCGTGRVLGFVDKQGHRALYVCPDANQTLSGDDLRRGLIASVRHVHCSSLSGDAAFAAQREFVTALPGHINQSFAPGAIYADRGIDELRPFLQRCAVLFLAQAELQALTGVRETWGGACRLINEGVQMVVITLGEGGSVVVTPAAQQHQAVITASVVDTTGAGDAFAAGFLYGSFKGGAVEDRHRFAAVVASFAVEAWGAREGLPSLAAAGERYERVFRSPCLFTAE